MKTLPLFLMTFLAGQAIACPICMPLPQQTVADQLIDAEVVAFGREDPEHPFSYAAVKILKGELADSHIELFADSATRRQLAADEKRFVLLVKFPGGWRCLGVADDEYQKIVRRILVFAPEWRGAEGQRKRLEYFLTLWNHENRAVFELAYLELGKAPYSSIQKFATAISIEELQPMLTRRDYLEWRSLAILMIAQRNDDATQQLITKTFENCARFSLTKNLPAWATAYVETHKTAGIDVINEKYLKDPARSEEEIRSVVAALSLHGRQDDAGLRARIVASYRSVLDVHPRVADVVVRDLTEWKESGFSREFQKILANSRLDLDPKVVSSLQNYILHFSH